MAEKIKVLYVDDEEQNLVSFRANFRKEYEVYTAVNADIALNILNDTFIPVIISDQRMPNITGVEFLEKVVELYPDTVRLLITAQSDIEIVIEAINRGQVSKYIQKPWDWDKLSIAIDNCVTLYTSRVELKYKNAELQKANDELNKFVYSVSHDLRSPLTSILGVVNLTKITPELKIAEPYFNMIEGRVLKLDTFIKNIIDYYKNARIEVLKESINLQELINQTWDVFKDQNSAITFDLKVNGDAIFIGDRFRIKIIFENLISNAVKYQNPTLQNKLITVVVKNDLDKLFICVSDNGIGIDNRYLKNIFDMFFRAEDNLQTDGTGVGLYLVKEAVNKMNGTIDVQSQILNGTNFNIVIPNK